MNSDQHDQDHLTADQIREKAENFLNFRFTDRGVDWYGINKENGFYDIQVKTSRGRNSKATKYRLQACPVCGNIQPMNFPAFRKHLPEVAKDLLKEERQRQAKDYIEHGEMPEDKEKLISRIERRNLKWDNNYCEQRHPPVAERPAHKQKQEHQANRMY